MCCIIKVSQKFLEKNTLLVQRLFYGIFITGCIEESLLFQPHPHTKKSRKVLEGEKKFRANAYFKKKFMVKLMG